MHTKARGDIAEAKATKYLIENGYRIIDKNVYNRFGEIDIIALRDEVLHFIEVKSAMNYEVAVNNITSSKLQKLNRTIAFYLQSKKLNLEYVIDAIIVVGNDIEFIDNIMI